MYQPTITTVETHRGILLTRILLPHRHYRRPGEPPFPRTSGQSGAVRQLVRSMHHVAGIPITEHQSWLLVPGSH